MAAPGSGYATRMPDITIHPHGDRWAVVEQGAESPTKEFPTREAAELAASQMATGGTVQVREDDPSGLGDIEPNDPGRIDDAGPGPGGVGAEEGIRERQAGL